MDIKSLPILSVKEVAQMLDVSVWRVHSLIKVYDIPHKALSCGKIFLQEDIETFQEQRKNKLKHRRKKKH